MPSNTDYLSKLAAYNKDNGITATFSEMKKTARRMQKTHEAMPEAGGSPSKSTSAKCPIPPGKRPPTTS
ncbi:hypothetical protein AHiyo6_03970 [Arthrobacter sp. Hiyo6]|nr:hypothetical protein AHiyo6_03970 [Arthrobacter sp. Hiyo6]